MMTEHMTLNSRRDAATWANNMGDLTDEQMERVADWIWENKPEIGCTYAEHPIYNMEGDEFWKIAEGDE